MAEVSIGAGFAAALVRTIENDRDRSLQAATAFIAAFSQVVEQIALSPGFYGLHHLSETLRVALVGRSQYMLLYRMHDRDHAHLVTLVPQRSNPSRYLRDD